MWETYRLLKSQQMITSVVYMIYIVVIQNDLSVITKMTLFNKFSPNLQNMRQQKTGFGTYFILRTDI